MKKLTTLIMALAAGCWSANAQLQFSFGPGAGFNYAVHTSSLSDESPGNFGPLITTQFDMQFSRSLALLFWVDVYSDFSAKEHVNNVSTKSAINYFSIAPTIKYCILRSPFYLFGGPGFGFKTIGKIKQTYHGMSAEEDIPDMKARIDIRMGAGYEFYLSNKLTFSPFAAFNAGMTDVVSYADWQVNALQVGFVLRYNTSK